MIPLNHLDYHGAWCVEKADTVKDRMRRCVAEVKTDYSKTSQSSQWFFWLRISVDVVVAAAIIGLFYLLLAILPQYRLTQKAKEPTGSELVEPVVSENTELGPVGEAEVTFADGEEPNVGQPAEIVTEENTKDKEYTGAFSKKFSQFFTNEIVKDHDVYTSPDISVQIMQVTDSVHGAMPFHAYIADIYVASVQNLQAGFPHENETAMADAIAEENAAVLAVNGDYYRNINKGILVRNGTVLQKEEGTSDICVIFEDGTMCTYSPGEYSGDRILEHNPWQIWSFGPALLNENGKPREEFNSSRNISGRNPRTAIGYFEPGHYCLVVIDGRQKGNSNGASFRALAAFMSDLGCKAAYNLDGGDSSVMVFGEEIISKPSGNRPLSDIVMVCELMN